MKAKIIAVAVTVLTHCAFLAHAQVTNFANFRPVRMTMERIDGTNDGEPGVFIRFSTDIGRVFRLESSTTLTNWTLVEQGIATDTNMSFWIPITNMTIIPSGGTNTNSWGPPPWFNGAMMASEGQTTIWPPLPYPWEPMYQPRSSSITGQALSSEGAATYSGESPSSSSFNSTSLCYRVVCPEDRIQFPEFEDFTEQYLYFDVWTSITGTYTIKLYQDATLVYSNTAAVPSSGRFGAYDGTYDPTDWPYTGFYAGSAFNLEVTVNGGGTTAQATVDPTIVDNDEGNNLRFVGCSDCYFDQFGP